MSGEEETIASLSAAVAALVAERTAERAAERAGPPAGVSAVSAVKTTVKLADFAPFHEEPEVWFRQAEIKFILGGISKSSVKACLVTEKFDAPTQRLVANIVLDSSTAYEDVKSLVIKTRGKSVRERIQCILSCPPMGAEALEDYAARLEALGEGISTTMILREIMLSNIPSSVAGHLRKEPQTLSLRDLAGKGRDDFAQGGVACPPGLVGAISSSSASAPIRPPRRRDTELLVEDCSEDDDESEPAINVAFRPSSRGGSRPQTARTPQRPRPPRQSATKTLENSRVPSSRNQGGGDSEKYHLCYFHARFGSNARSCEGRCHMGKGKAGGPK